MRYLMALAAVLFGFVPMAWAQNGMADRIVAVVNDDVITLSELQERTQLSARALQIGAVNAAQAAALQRRTLMEMIDEQLQQQYAASNNMAFTKAEVQQAKDAAISTMGQSTWDALTKGLVRAGNAKVLAEATWARLQDAAIRPRVQVAGPEVDRMITEMSKSRNQIERNISMIFIPRETGISGTDVSALMAEVRAQATAPGATQETFAALARTYSAAPTAKNGGAMGWLLPEEMPTAIANALEDTKEGDITSAIPTSEGEILVRVNALRKKDNTVNFEPREERLLALVAMARPSGTDVVKGATEALKEATDDVTDWADVQAMLRDKAVVEAFPRTSMLGWVPLTALQPAVRDAIKRTRVGHWSGVVDDKGQLSRLYVAEERRIMPPEALALRERVQQSLLGNRMEMESRRFMRELRQRAFVDIRL